MAFVVGTIRSAGQGVAGLLVKAFEEVSPGFPDDDKPCRFVSPSSRQIGQGTTDATGDFSISYAPRARPEAACGFKANVRIVVFDGATLVFQSPKRIRAETTRFDRDLLPPQPLPGEDTTARIVGTLTRCGKPAAGHRIVAFEEVIAGFPSPPRPCVQSAPRIRRVGTAIVDDQGRFEIRYVPTAEDEEACSFSQNVRVTAFDGVVVVWQSPDRSFSPTVRFDHELYPGCTAGSTLVRVVDDGGRRVRGAEVFADGTSRGLTDGAGQLFVSGLNTGSVLVARLRIHEQKTDRERHGADSDQNWNYRVYITSATLTHDRDGNFPRFQMTSVADPGAVQDLVILRRNTIIGFNILMSVEWDATRDQMNFFRDRMLEVSELIFNATDGQFLFERVAVADNGVSWNNADFRVYADWNQGSNARVDGIHGKDGVIRMNPYDMMFPGGLLHEFGHYGFGGRDEYEPAGCWPDDEPNVGCTLQAFGDPTPFSHGGTKDACFLRGAQIASRKKLCSSHPANPHVRCTEQGDEDCWSVVAQRYGGNPAWRLLTPLSRGAIVDRLPDSGLPFGGSTRPHRTADRADSYIPVLAWKPTSSVRLVERPGECPNLIVRVVVDGVPRDNTQVTLQTSDGRSILQGRTAALNLPDDMVTGPGEIAVRGAHIGDSVRATFSLGPVTIGGTVEITSCASPLILEMPSVGIFTSARTALDAAGDVRLSLATGRPAEPLPPPVISVLQEGELEPFAIDSSRGVSALDHAIILTSDEDQDAEVQITSFDAAGNALLQRSRIAQRLLRADERRTLVSATGDLELVVPAGAIECPARVVIDDAIDVPLPPIAEGDQLLVRPQRVTCTRGERLHEKAVLHLNPANLNVLRPADVGSIDLLSYDAATAAWRPVKARVNLLPTVASASIDRLGVFALVRRMVATYAE